MAFPPPAPPTARALAELVTGNYLRFLGSLLVLCGGAEGIVTHHRNSGAGVLLAALTAGVGGVLYYLAPMLFNTAWATARGPRSREAAQRLFLYLRPFEFDAGTLAQLSLGASCGLVVGRIVWLQPRFAVPWQMWVIFCTGPLWGRVGDEQNLQSAFGAFGRLITFGHPGKRLRPVGVWRHNASEQWKSDVTDYMREARLVIFRPGSSPSIQWELHQLLDTVPAERILFYIRFAGSAERRQQAWEAFCTQVRMHIPANLPGTPGRARYLLIDSRGNARLLAPENRPAAVLAQVISGDFDHERLRPVLEALADDFRIEPRGLLGRLLTRCLREPLWVDVVFAALLGFSAALVITTLLVLVILAF